MDFLWKDKKNTREKAQNEKKERVGPPTIDDIVAEEAEMERIKLEYEELEKRLLDEDSKALISEDEGYKGRLIELNRSLQENDLFDLIGLNNLVKVRDKIAGSIFSEGVSIETRDDFGRTPLICAANVGFDQIVKMLLLLGAEIDAVDNNGGTALINAIWNRRKNCARVLIEAGASIDIRDKDGGIAFVYAGTKANWEVLQFLISSAKTPREKEAILNSTDKQGNTALIRACQNHYDENLEDVIYLLIESKCDIDIMNKKREKVFDVTKDSKTFLALLQAVIENYPDHEMSLKMEQRKKRGLLNEKFHNNLNNEEQNGEVLITVNSSESESEEKREIPRRKVAHQRSKRRPRKKVSQ